MLNQELDSLGPKWPSIMRSTLREPPGRPSASDYDDQRHGCQAVSDRANGRGEQKKVILDLDSSESPVYGEQGVRPAMATSDAMVIIRLSASTFRWRRSPYRAAFSQRSFVGSVGYAQCRSDGTGSGQRHRKTRLRRGKLSAAVGKQRYPAPFGSV